VLHAQQNFPQWPKPCVLVARNRGHADERVQLVDRSVGLNARSVLGNALTSDKAGVTGVAALGVNPIERDAARFIERFLVDWFMLWCHTLIVDYKIPGLTPRGYNPIPLGWGFGGTSRERKMRTPPSAQHPQRCTAVIRQRLIIYYGFSTISDFMGPSASRKDLPQPVDNPFYTVDRDAPLLPEGNCGASCESL
jgi:hypothetical protein